MKSKVNYLSFISIKETKKDNETALKIYEPKI